ncbi:MAG: hypothetical protein QN773_03455 [Nitrososphaeraceae archaeon]|nr:hypothetical protein [Nitrososphaeraceae archaeon]
MNTKKVLMFAALSIGIFDSANRNRAVRLHQHLPTGKSVKTMMTTTVTRGLTR